MNNKSLQSRRRPVNAGTKPQLHPNAAFIKAAAILLTTEGYQQIKELADHMANPNNEASA